MSNSKTRIDWLEVECGKLEISLKHNYSRLSAKCSPRPPLSSTLSTNTVRLSIDFYRILTVDYGIDYLMGRRNEELGRLPKEGFYILLPYHPNYRFSQTTWCAVRLTRRVRSRRFGRARKA